MTSGAALGQSLSSVSVSPSSVVGGNGSTGTVTLSANAPAGGVVVSLSSAPSATATVPATVNVAAGVKTATFPITTSQVTTNVTVTVSAVYASVTKTATLTVKPLLLSVALSPTSLVGGAGSTGTVSLNGAAPAGGASVALSSNHASATVPSAVTVPAGATSATFAVTTSVVTANATATITANHAGVPKTATLTVRPLLLSVSLNRSSVAGGHGVTGTVTLNAVAPSGGASVTLSSSVTTRATVPASVAVPSGQLYATFSVATLSVAASGNTVISAAHAGASVTSTLTVTPTAAAYAVTLDPSNVFGTATATGTVTLNAPAPSAGTGVTLTSGNTAVATVPATVTVPGGASLVSFTITTATVAASTNVAISAAAGGVTRSATLAVAPALTAFGMQLDPVSVVSAGTSTATIALNGPAPSGGSVVTLTSANTGTATVPASVTVAFGARSATFTVTAKPTTTTKTVNISGLFGGVTKSATLTVTPSPVALAVTFSPPVVTSGDASTATFFLNGPAPAGGAILSLYSSSGVLTTPASVTVAAGSSSATLPLTSAAVANASDVSVSANYGGITSKGTLVVTPGLPSGLSLSPSIVTAGSTSTGTVTLSGNAPTGGTVVALSSSNTSAATVPATVTVPAAATSATFTVTTLSVASPTSATISATRLGILQNAGLTVNPGSVALSGVSLSPASVVGGNGATGTVTLTANAPAGGVNVALSSTLTSAATVPSSVTVAAGSTTASFAVTTLGVAATSSPTISAVYSGVTKTAVLTVNPAALTTISVSPASVVGGNPSTGTATLNGHAPPGGASVSLSSSLPAAASVPATVSIPSGATSATFGVTSSPVAATATPSLSGVYSGVTKNATLTVTPPALSTLSITPTTVSGGMQATGTVTLTGAAPAGGIAVTLGSSNPAAATVPVSVTVAAAATSATFAVTALNVASSTGVTITASRAGVNKPVNITVTPCALASVPPPSSFPPGDTVWSDDAIPAGAFTGSWSWVATQKASGSQSHTDPAASGFHEHYFEDASPGLYVGATDKLVAYVLTNPCDPPREIMLQVHSDQGWEHRAFWGEDLIDRGTLGTPSRMNMGALPAAGQWVRLEVPASALGIGGLNVYGVSFMLWDGEAWWDRVGKTLGCTVPVAAAPSPPAETIWMDDAIPTGAFTGGTWVWDTVQKASGAQSHTEPARYWIYEHFFEDANPGFPVGASDKLVTYVLINPCDPPREIMLQIHADDGWEHRPYWGEDLIDAGIPGTPGRLFMGPMPTAGEWVRLEVPASALAIGGQNVYGVSYLHYSGQAWWDRLGSTAAAPTPSNSALTLVPASVVGPNASTGTVLLTAPALSGGAVVSLSSSQTTVATVPASVTVPAGSTTANFTVTTFSVASNTSVTISSTYDGVTKTAVLTVTPPEASLSSVSVTPTTVPAGYPSTGTATLTATAPAGGTVVSLSSSNTGVATVPASVTIAAGATSATFSVATLPVASDTPVTISATLAGITRTAELTVTPCTVSTASPPGSFPPDSVWFDDATPTGAVLSGTWNWDTAQKASGTQSHTEPVAGGTHQHVVDGFNPGFDVRAGDQLVAYVLVNPCNPPRELMLQWKANGNWEHRAFWGEDLIAWGTSGTPSRAPMGALPAAGQWVRLEVPAAAVDLVGRRVTGVAFALFDGKVWWDRVGSTAPPVSLSLAPSSVAAGLSATGTVLLGQPAPTGGAVVNLSSSNTAVATVPTSVTVAAAATSGTFTVSTSAAAAPATVTISAAYSGFTSPAPLTVYRTAPPSGELTENNAASWGSFAQDAAATSVSDDTTRVKVGARSIQFTTASGVDTGLRYPASGDAHWDLTGLQFLSFWLYAVNPNGFQGAQPVIVLKTNGGDIQFQPAFDYMYVDQWHLYQVALTGDSFWIRTVTGSPNLADVLQIELHHDTWSAGFTLHYDGLEFIADLPGELTEGTGANWTAFAADAAAVSVADDTTRVKVGSQAVKFVTAGGIDTGVRYPANGTANWDVSGKDHLSFWIYAVNANSAFQGNQPTVILKSSGGSFRYEAQGTLMTKDVWRHYQIPLAGGGPWVRTVTGSPALSDIDQIEIHHDTIGSGFTLWYDGLGFGGPLGAPDANLTTVTTPGSIVGSFPVIGTVTLDAPAPAGGAAVALSSSNTSVASVPASVTVSAGALSANFTVTTTQVSNDTAVTLTGTYRGVSRTANLTVRQFPALAFVRSIPNLVPLTGPTSQFAVTLTAPAPPGGAAVSLSASNPAAVSMPASVTVPADATSAGVTITPVASGTNLELSATYRGVTKKDWLTILAPVQLKSAFVNPTTLVGGSYVTFGAELDDVTLSSRTVNLTSSHPSILSVPASLTIAPLRSAAAVTVATGTVASSTPVTLTATSSGVTKTAVLTVTPATALESLTLNPASIRAYGATVATVTLNAPAPAGGATVTLSATGHTFGELPASAVIPRYLRSFSFLVYAGNVTTPTDVPITASYAGGSTSASLNIVPSLAVSTVTLSPDSVIGGGSLTGSVVLNSSSTTSTVVTLTSSNPSLVGVPASVTVPASATSAGFNVTTLPVDLPATVTVTATLGGVSRGTDLLLTHKPVLSALSLSRSSTAQGWAVSGTVTLNGPAQAGGEQVLFWSSNDAVAAVPASLTVPEGQSSTAFSVTPGTVSSPAGATITALAGGLRETVDLTVTPAPVLLSTTLAPVPSGAFYAEVVGGQSATGTLSLNAPAPAGGAVVTLAAGDPAAVVPVSVTIPAGTYSAPFTITTSGVTDVRTVGISGSYQGGTTAAILTIRAPELLQLFFPVSGTPGLLVNAGDTFTARVVLTGIAPSGGTVVSLSAFSTSVSATIPSSVTVPAGSSSADFSGTVGFGSGPCLLTVEIRASLDGILKVGTLDVVDLRVVSVSFVPPRVVGGTSATGTVAFNGAPGASRTVTLTSSNVSLVSVPASVSVSGSSSVQFTATTSVVGSETPVTVSATYGVHAPVAGVLTVSPQLSVASVSLNPTSVVGGTPSTGTVYLNGAAPTGGAVVTLSSSNTARATVPASVTVPAGLDSATFSVTTTTGTNASVTITATYSGSSKTAVLSITSGTAASSVSVAPSSVVGGSPATGTVTLNVVAPAGGLTVTLSSSHAAAAVPATVTVPNGATSATFTVTTTSVASDTPVTITAVGGGATVTTVLTVRPPSPQIDGVAPGVTFAGTSNVIAYGSNFAAGTTLLLRGPVYTITDTTTQLCNETQGACPSVTASSTINGGQIAFSVPSGQATGFYRVRARSSSGVLSNPIWFKVDATHRTFPAVIGAQHDVSKRIYTGQTIAGSFVDGGDPAGNYSDYNDYFFIGTAGSTISVTLDRADASLSWEDPVSLDPQIEVIAPDGMIYQNLISKDKQPGVDYNASLTNAVLPSTGIYHIRVSSLKGSGEYTLTFTANVAAVPASQRAIAFADNYQTVPVGNTATVVAAMLDPRGHPVSGAMANFAAVPGPDNGGTVQFVYGSRVETGWDGAVSVTVRLASAGRVELSAAMESPLLALGQGSEELAKASGNEIRIPRYPPVAMQEIDGIEVAGEEQLRVERGTLERLPVWSPSALREAQSEEFRSRENSEAGIGVSENTGDALSARPIPQGGALSKEAITSCSTALFTVAGVAWATVTPPFTFTLEDLTPRTGQSVPPGLVGAEGIWGHRVEKVVRFKLDIRDGTGSQPPYPVLVSLAIGGGSGGRLILDPDGARIECVNATFLWHERNAQGQIIALNEEFEYRMGTYAPYVGVVPDAGGPGGLKAVYGTAETLRVLLSTVDGAGVTQRYRRSFKVSPDPGKPDHFAFGSRLRGGPDDPVESYWADAHLSMATSPRSVTPPIQRSNHLFLVDRFENVTFGYTQMTPAAPSPGPGITVSFWGQVSGVPGFTAVEYPGYGYTLSWSESPAVPEGVKATTISVTYPVDPEWAGGAVSRSVQYRFDRAQESQPYHYLWQGGGIYDKHPCISLGPWAQDAEYPIVVSPGAEGDGLPTVEEHHDPILGGPVSSPELFGQPSRLAFTIKTRSLRETSPYCDPAVTGHLCEEGVPENWWLEVRDSPAFRVSIVDGYNRVAEDAIFAVHRCPRCSHNEAQASEACSLDAVPSDQGIVASVRLNPGTYPNGDNEGYMGIELVRAPTTPGDYYIKFETLEGKQYRIREFADLTTDYSDAGQYQGAFHFVTVSGGEFLDSSFRRFSPAGLVKVTDPITVYLRYRNTSGAGPATAGLESTLKDGTVLQSGVSLTLNRVMKTSDYIGAFTAVPERYTGTIPTDKPSIQIALGGGFLKATQASAAPLSMSERTTKQSVNGGLLALAPTAFPGKLKLSFLQRGSTCVDRSCLTLAGSPNEGRFQETVIVPNYNYAEVVRLLVEAVNPHDSTQIQDINATVLFTEIPNLQYIEDLSSGKPRLFYQGFNLSSWIKSDGQLFDPTSAPRPMLNRGRAAFNLYSVATARYDATTGELVRTTPISPYVGKIKSYTSPVGPVGPVLPIESDEFTISHWVDERRYERNRANREKTWAPGSGWNVALDWLEMRALDYFADGVGVPPEGEDVLVRPTTVKDNWDLPPQIDALVPWAASSTIEIKPEKQLFRFDVNPGSTTDSHYYGLISTVDRTDRFRRLMSHEARHCWQLTLKATDGLADNDDDELFPTPPVSSPELKDAAYPSNPEFSFLGDTTADGSASRSAALEHNADRFAAVNVPGFLSCAPISWATLSYGSSPPQLLGQLVFVDDIGASVPLPGALVKIEKQAVGAQCDTPSGWSLVGYSSTDAQGWVNYGLPSSGVYRFTLIPPSECASLVRASCTTVP